MTIEKNKSFFMMDSSEGNANKEKQLWILWFLGRCVWL